MIIILRRRVMNQMVFRSLKGQGHSGHSKVMHPYMDIVKVHVHSCPVYKSVIHQEILNKFAQMIITLRWCVMNIFFWG